MYVVTRQDLTPGNQAAQATHAALTFAFEHPDIFRSWHETSQYLVLLAAPDEAALLGLPQRAERAGLSTSTYREPDFDDSVTAVVIEPGELTSKICANYPLALREDCMA